MIRPTPFTDLLSVFDAMNEATSFPVRSERAGSSSRGITRTSSLGMPIDCYTTNDHAVVMAALPGVHPDEVSVTVDKDVLAISGSITGERMAHDEHGDPVTWFMSEIPRGSYERRIKLPFAIEEDAVEAQFSHGLLRVVLPKLEATKPRRIDVRVMDDRMTEIAAEGETQPAETTE